MRDWGGSGPFGALKNYVLHNLAIRLLDRRVRIMRFISYIKYLERNAKMDIAGANEISAGKY